MRLCVLDADNRLQQLKSTDDVLRKFFEIRRPMYVQRKNLTKKTVEEMWLEDLATLQNLLPDDLRDDDDAAGEEMELEIVDTEEEDILSDEEMELEIVDSFGESDEEPSSLGEEVELEIVDTEEEDILNDEEMELEIVDSFGESDEEPFSLGEEVEL